MDLALRVGHMLLSNGAGTADVSATMSSICYHMGLRGTYVDVTYIMMTMVHQHEVESVPLVLRRNVTQRVTDYGAVTDVDHIVRDLLADNIDLDEARRRVTAVETRGYGRPRPVIIVANGFVGAGVAVYIGGDWIVALIALLAGVLIETMRGRIAKFRLPEFYTQVAGGMCASLLAVGATALNISTDQSLVIASNIVALLAGLGLLAAVQDALTGYYLTAAARLLEVLLATAGIVVGVTGGLAIGGLFGVDVLAATELPNLSQLPSVILGAAVAAAAFAVASYAPWRIVLPIAVIGALSAAVATFLTEQDLPRAWAVGIAATMIGLIAYPVSLRGRVPSLVIAVSAMVPLLPGLTIYRALAQLAEENMSGVFASLTAVAIAISVAAGVILGEYIAQPVYRETRRLEQRMAGPRLVGPFRATGRSRRLRPTIKPPSLRPPRRKSRKSTELGYPQSGPSPDGTAEPDVQSEGWPDAGPADGP